MAGGDDQVAPGADGGDLHAWWQGCSLQAVEEARRLGQLLDRLPADGGGVGPHRVDGGPGDLPHACATHEGQGGGHLLARVRGAQRDHRVGRREGGVARIGLVGQRQAGDDAAVAVGDEVDGHAGVLLLEPLQQPAQAAARLAQVLRGVPPGVGRLRRRLAVLAAVREADDVAGGVAERRGVEVVYGRAAELARGVEAAHGDRDVPLPERGRGDVGRGAPLPLCPPVHRRPRHAGHAHRRVDVPGVVGQGENLFVPVDHLFPGLLVGALGDLAHLVARPGERPLAHVEGTRGRPGERPEQPVALACLAAGSPLLVGDEVDLRRAAREQPQRVDVGVACPGAEVEAIARRAHLLAGRDSVTPADGDRSEERVAGADAVVVKDDHVKGAADCPGVDHLPGGGGADRRARRRGVVDATIAPGPRLGWRPEGVDQRGVDGGPVVDAVRFGTGRNGPREDGDCGQHHGHTAHREPPGRRRRPGGRGRASASGREARGGEEGAAPMRRSEGGARRTLAPARRGGKGQAGSRCDCPSFERSCRTALV